MGLRYLGAVVLIGTASAGTALAQSDATDVERNWSEIVACSTISSARDRQACMDGVVLRSGAISNEEVESRSRREFGRDESARPVNAPAVTSRVSSPANDTSIPTEVTEITTAIATVRTVGYQRLRVTTADGSMWDQTQAESFNSGPKAGDPFSIERTAFGAFRCRFAQAKRYYCQRVD